MELISFDFLESASFLEVLSLSWNCTNIIQLQSLIPFLFEPSYITSLQMFYLTQLMHQYSSSFLDLKAKSNLTHP